MKVPAAGYSGTPLIRKLGIKSSARIHLVGAPTGFERTLGPLPAGTRSMLKGTLDFAILFTRTQADLHKHFPRLRDRLETNGMLWVAWPKKAARIENGPLRKCRPRIRARCRPGRPEDLRGG